MIFIELHNTEAILKGLTDKKIFKELDILLSYQVQGYQYANATNHWDGRYRLLKNSGKFPIGLLDTVEKILKKHTLEYKVEDLREAVKYGTSVSLLPNSPFTGRDYQQAAIATCLKEGSGVVRMCTGSGKSFVIASLAAHYNVLSVIYVTSIDLLHQMAETLKLSYGIEAGMIGDGICDIKKINIMTIWSAAAAFNQKLDKKQAEDIYISKKKEKESDKEKIRNLVQTAKVILADECQFWGSDSCVMLSKLSLGAYHRFLFSGTPWREQGDSILLEAIAGKKIIDISASYLIERGFLVQPKILFKEVSKKTNCGTTYQEVYKNYIEDNDERNELAINACKNFVNQGKRVIMSVKKIRHGKIIKEKLDILGIDSVFLDGTKSSEERSNGISDIKKGKINVIIASSIFDQGIDISVLDAIIILSAGKSTGKFLQKIGRTLRIANGKKEAFVLDFFDNCKYLKEHSKIRMKTAQSESKFIVKKS